MPLTKASDAEKNGCVNNRDVGDLTLEQPPGYMIRKKIMVLLYPSSKYGVYLYIMWQGFNLEYATQKELLLYTHMLFLFIQKRPDCTVESIHLLTMTNNAIKNCMLI